MYVCMYVCMYVLVQHTFSLPLCKSVTSSNDCLPWCALFKVLLGKSVVVCVGDGCLLPLLLLQLKRERSNLDLPDHYCMLTSCSHSCALVKEVRYGGVSRVGRQIEGQFGPLEESVK